MTLSSLRLRLLAAGAVSVIAGLALAGLGLVLVFERHVERRALAELSTHLDQVIAALDRRPDGPRLVLLHPPADPRFAQPLSGLYWQVSANPGTVVLRSRSLWDAALVVPPDLLNDGQVHDHRIPGPGGASLLILERLVTLPDRLDNQRVRVIVGLDRADLAAATRAFAHDLWPYLAILALGLILANAAQTLVGLRPLATVQARVGAVRAGSRARLGQDVPDEIRPLAAEVDALLEAREADVARARARAADLAHGLKTPLQVLAGDIDRLRAQGEADIAAGLAQVAQAMRRHVDRELARARLATGRRDSLCRPAAVATRLLAVVRRTPDGSRRHWDLQIDDSLTARIDADDLTETLGALLENAARHAHRRVAITGRQEGRRCILDIADDGPGIPPNKHAAVLGRGERLDTAGPGSGLGLAIAADILAAWDGGLSLHAADGGGLLVRLDLDSPPGARASGGV